ncbi:hypothetical protein B0H19DRAFT_5459, partial [Mycena capillaripes]
MTLSVFADLILALLSILWLATASESREFNHGRTWAGCSRISMAYRVCRVVFAVEVFAFLNWLFHTCLYSSARTLMLILLVGYLHTVLEPVGTLLVLSLTAFRASLADAHVELVPTSASCGWASASLG